MQRILEPGQIEASAQRAIPRIRPPDRTSVFAVRAARLRKLAEGDHAIADYLRLMAVLADAQHAALGTFAFTPPTADELARAKAYGMPAIHATSWRREGAWRDVLGDLRAAVESSPATPGGVRAVLGRVAQATPAWLESQAEALLAGGADGVDAATAPFLMAALQVCWVDLASRIAADDVAELGAPGLCPMCGTLPVASIVHSDARSQGYRYLHCALCATEWHLVRVTCSHCRSTKGISYQSIEGGSGSVRAECCDQCRTYRKIVYQEQDAGVEPLADDLASLSLDLLLAEAGYHRASANPLLWQARAAEDT